MSNRYDDTYRERNYDRQSRYERGAEGREAGRGVREDVRETGRDVREAGGDIVNSVCGLWGNLLGNLGDAITPRSSRSRSSARVSSQSEDDESRESSTGLFNCLGGEFSVKCGRSESEGGRSSDSSADRDDYRGDRSRDDRTSARISGPNTEIDVST
jgi:hypothetical protein